MSDHIGKTEGEFSVVQTFEDGGSEYVRRWVGAEEAAEAFKHYTQSIAAKMGMTVDVKITDGGDCTNFHWKFGEGVVFPKGT